MRHTNEQSIKEAIEEMMRTYRIKNKFDETAVIANWETIMGKTVANRTSEIFVKNKKLFIRLTSAALKHEMLIAREQMIDLVNNHFGSQVVNEVVFL